MKREKLSAWSCAHINGYLSRMLHVAGEKMLAGLEPLSGGGIDTNCGKAGVISSNSRRIKVCSAPKRTEEKAHR